jgi:hypothetical protein
MTTKIALTEIRAARYLKLLEKSKDYPAHQDEIAVSVLTFLEVGTTERGSAINAAMQFADQTGFTRGKFQWCSAYADALVRTLVAGDKP